MNKLKVYQFFSPFPEVHWNFTDGALRNFPNISSSWSIHLTATNNVSVEGHYHCSVSNELGSQKKTIQVIVQGESTFTLSSLAYKSCDK